MSGGRLWKANALTEEMVLLTKVSIIVLSLGPLVSLSRDPIILSTL
jgi:hypothetical protein